MRASVDYGLQPLRALPWITEWRIKQLTRDCQRATSTLTIT